MYCHNAPFALAEKKEDAAPRLLVPQVRCTDNMIFRAMNNALRAKGVEDVTAMHGWILRYLYEHQGEEIYQKDVEKAFSITRSSVTSIVQLMEKKGYLRRESVSHDARLKRLVLTPAGIAAHQKIHETIHQFSAWVDGRLTPQENQQLLDLLEKLQDGLRAKAAEKPD